MNNNSTVNGILLFIICVLCFGGCCVVGGYEYSDGFRDGQLQKFAKKGMIWHTWEGELALPGFQSEAFGFTVSDNTVAEQLNNTKPGVHLRLHYKQKLVALPWNGSTTYFIWKVEQTK